MHLNEFNNGDDYHFGIPHRYSTHYLLLEELRKQLKIKPGHFSYQLNVASRNASRIELNTELQGIL